jgi:hypothetical protein
MKKEQIVVSFRCQPDIKDLTEILAKKQGKSKSEFVSLNIVDTALNFERTRFIDGLQDFLSVSLPYLVQGMSEEESQKVIDKLTKLQRTYIKQRLDSHLKIQKKLTDIAIKSYMQNYAEEMDDSKDTFIINQCLQSIYDHLFELKIISRDEWEEKSRHYRLYMEEQGLKLLHQE